jgi:hypothetical protein
VPHLLSPALEHLALTGTSIERLGSINFYAALLTLNLTGGRVAALELGTFQEQAHLETLDLSDNLLTEVSPGGLSGLHRLVHLDLSDNQLESLAPRLFLALPALLRLSLAGNPLGALPVPSLSLPPGLLSLDLAACSLRGLDELPALPALRRLQLAGNPLGPALPSRSLAHLPRLQHLGLANTSLSAQPERALAGLLHLTELDLGSNLFPSLGPGALPPLPALQTLQLSGCPSLTLLHTAALPRLQRLAAAHCPRLVTWSTEPLPALGSLDLRGSAPALPSPALLPALASVHLAGRPLLCSCALLPWRLLLLSLPPARRDSPTCRTGLALLARDLGHCSAGGRPSALAVGLGLGLLLLLALLAGLSFRHRARAAAWLGRLSCRHQACTQAIQYQQQLPHQEDYWLSLARRAQARPPPGQAVPVTEL